MIVKQTHALTVNPIIKPMHKGPPNEAGSNPMGVGGNKEKKKAFKILLSKHDSDTYLLNKLTIKSAQKYKSNSLIF